jgi:hypothetical protein
MVDKAALGQVFSSYFGFPCHSINWMLDTQPQLSFEAGTLGQIMADVPSGLSLTPARKTKTKKKKKNYWLKAKKIVITSSTKLYAEGGKSVDS